MMQPWKTLSRRTVVAHSKFLTVENHTVQLPDGRVISEWPWVVLPDYVNVIAVTEGGQFLCLHQTKYAVNGTSLAAIGGYVEPGEEPLAAAKRELLEETGYKALKWVNLGSYQVDGNRGAGTAHLFLAQDASCVTQPSPDDLEEQRLVLLSRSEVHSALAAGDFKVLPWVAAVALALHYPKDPEQAGPAR
jgi:8-oxo-dGTP pyrophosphatase MutT (NUDIX family)